MLKYRKAHLTSTHMFSRCSDSMFQFANVWTLVRGIYPSITPNTMLKRCSRKYRPSQSLEYVILPRLGAFSSSSSLSVALFFLFPVFPVAPEVLSARDNEAGTEPVGVDACDGVFESGPSCACVELSAYAYASPRPIV
jgi:hypothetical protein